MQNLDTLLVIGAAQGLFLALFLFGHKRGNRLANRTLSFVVLLFSLSIILHTMVHSGILPDFPDHEMVIELFFTLISPLLYLYIKAMTERNFSYNKSMLKHAIPFVTGILLLSTWLMLGTIIDFEPFAHGLISIIVFGQAIFYLYLCLKSLRLHSRNIKSTYSSLERINLKWLFVLIIAYASLWVLGLFAEAFLQEVESWDYGWLLVSICLYLIGYMAMKQPEIFTGEITENGKEIKKSSKKYEKSTLDSETADYYQDKLEKLMFVDKPYLENTITLPVLANKLSVSQHHLSQIINEKYGLNFFQFINKHRIDEAKRLMSDPSKSHLKIAAISYDAGFSSLSTFNSAFKKMCGMTPSQFRSSLDNN